MKNKQERFNWIKNYLKENFSADVLNTNFHEKYHEAFPKYKYRATNWGSQPVNKAMKDLKEMYELGILDRGRVGIQWQPGFPKSVLIYILKGK